MLSGLRTSVACLLALTCAFALATANTAAANPLPRPLIMDDRLISKERWAQFAERLRGLEIELGDRADFEIDDAVYRSSCQPSAPQREECPVDFPADFPADFKEEIRILAGQIAGKARVVLVYDADPAVTQKPELQEAFRGLREPEDLVIENDPDPVRDAAALQAALDAIAPERLREVLVILSRSSRPWQSSNPGPAGIYRFRLKPRSPK